jgi:hypothetical protein
VQTETTLCFVGASRGNAFMNELLAAVAHEVEALGVRTELALDTPTDDGSQVYVLIPHEYFATVRKEHQPSREQLTRTIALCTEQPGTPWFDVSESHARRASAIVDINVDAVRELRRRGVRAEHFRLGYTSFWDSWRRDEGEDRATDVLFLGAVNERRLEALAGYAETLWPHRTRILVPPERPKTEERPDFLLGESKWRALRSSKILLNLHRQPSPYFEWVRVLESIANGCVVVSEHSADSSPLVPGKHYVSGSLANLGFLADGLLADEASLSAMRATAYDFVRSELTLRPATERLVAIAESLRRSRARGRRRAPGDRRRLRRSAHELVRRATYDPRLDSLLEHQGELRSWSRRADARLKRLVLGQIELTRRLALHELAIRGVSPDEVRVVERTPAYGRGTPRISVLIPLYNHADEVRLALASVAAAEFEALEVVVLDDASTDGSLAAVRDVLRELPFLAGLLLAHPVNRGLGRTRNDLVAAARGEYVFMLDADNEVFPTAFSRLAAVLDADRSASFSYPMLQVHAGGRPETLRSFYPWEPNQLRGGNFVDALALLRREDVVRLGGYAEDLRLYGWEDYDLWCRFAEHGLRGVLVPEILARYRRSDHSMLASITDVDVTEAESVLQARYPVTMGRRNDREVASP